MVRCLVPLALVNFAAAIRGGKYSRRNLQINDIVVVSPSVNDQVLLSPKYSPVESPTYEEPSYIQAHNSSPGNDRSKFEKECYYYLLSKYVTDDELISQHDFASFLTEYCRWEEVCDKGETLEYEMLPSPIQIAFADPLCEGENICIKEGQENFGYVYNKSTYHETETQIEVLCKNLYPLVGQYVSSTPGKKTRLIRCFGIKVNKNLRCRVLATHRASFQPHRYSRTCKRLMSLILTLRYSLSSIPRQPSPQKSPGETRLSCGPPIQYPSPLHVPRQTLQKPPQ